MKTKLFFALTIAGALMFTSCKKDVITEPGNLDNAVTKKVDPVKFARDHAGYNMTIAMTSGAGNTQNALYRILENGQVLYNYNVTVDLGGNWKDYKNVCIGVSEKGDIYAIAKKPGNSDHSVGYKVFKGVIQNIKSPIMDQANVKVPGLADLHFEKQYSINSKGVSGGKTEMYKMEVVGNKIYGIYNGIQGRVTLFTLPLNSTSNVETPNVINDHVSTQDIISSINQLDIVVYKDQLYLTFLREGRIYNLDANGYIHPNYTTNNDLKINTSYKASCGSSTGFINFGHENFNGSYTEFKSYSFTGNQVLDIDNNILTEVVKLGNGFVRTEHIVERLSSTEIP